MHFRYANKIYFKQYMVLFNISAFKKDQKMILDAKYWIQNILLKITLNL